MLAFVMPDPASLVTAALTGIAGSLATLVKDGRDKAAVKKELASIKAQLHEVAEGLERLRGRVKQQSAARQVSDPGIADLQRQLDDAHGRLDDVQKRLDERDTAWTNLQREIGAINAKLEILLSR